MCEVKPVPAFRLGRGCQVAGYTLLHPVGRGWESTSYLAAERLSGAVRRLKFYRAYGSGDIAAVGHVAATFDRLHGTGAVPAYHHMDIWRRNARESVPFLALGFIDGAPLTRLLKPGRWRRGWSDATGLRLLRAVAAKLATVHGLGLGVGNFQDGNNIIVKDRRDPVWCDLDAGTPDEPNRDREADLLALVHPAGRHGGTPAGFAAGHPRGQEAGTHPQPPLSRRQHGRDRRAPILSPLIEPPDG